jgi:hypothetical protein
MKDFKQFLLTEWLDSPGSIDVPGQNTEIRVKSRNYNSTNPQLPEVVDSLFEANDVYDFLDEHGNSEDFNKFIKEKKRSGRQITDHIKEKLKLKKDKK